jgi:hypothetical protein
MLALVGSEERMATGETAVRLNELTSALTHELRLIEELRSALLRQRAGVAADDSEAIESSVQAVGRTLLTLEEARRRRTSLTEFLTGNHSSELADLERYVGCRLPEPLQLAREGVRRAATAAAQDARINQNVLRRALEAGDAFLQQLFSTAIEPAPAYLPGTQPAESRPPSVLFNRTA